MPSECRSRRFRTPLPALLALLAFLLVPLPAGASSDDHGLERVPGSFFVTFEEGADRGPVRGMLRAWGAELRHEYASTPGRVNVRGLPPGAQVALAGMPGVLAVTADFVVRAHLADSVALVGAGPVLAGTDGGSGIHVCVIDTGIRADHLMFADAPGRVGAWADFVQGLGVPYDDNGHGSHVAGIVGGAVGPTIDGEPFHGVAPGVTLYVAKALDAAGSGSFSDVIAAVEWCSGFAASSPAPAADVINLSLGGGAFTAPCDEDDPTGAAAAVNAAAGAGILVVSSSGNDGNRNGVGTPACATGSMAVGATYDANVGRLGFRGCTDRKTAADRIACFSNRWDHLDVVAPGCVVHSADPSTAGTVAGMCGTSQASPHVAGLAALVLAANPGMSAADARDCINRTAADLGEAGFDRTYGHGRIEAAAAVACDLTCTPTEAQEATCGDGLDNDCDGLIDGDDADCGTDGCLLAGMSCVGGDECCSGKCKGKPGNKTCN